jgi:Tol biopolymer transport system component
MSPEQVRGQELDSRTDLFSLGTVLYEMATGMVPFRGETSTDICDSILNDSSPSPRTVNSKIPAELGRVIAKALEKDRERRYQSAADMRRDLRRLIEQRAGVWSPVLLVATVVVAVLVAAILWWWAGRRPDYSPRVVERQITDHPPEDWVTGGAVSPDGRTVAYHDQTGVYLRSLDSGETRAIPLAPEFNKLIWDLAWMPDGKSLIVQLPRTDVSEGVTADFWTFSANGAPAPHELWRNVSQVSVSPDGKSIAFLRNAQPYFHRPGGLFVARLSDGSERMLRAREEKDDWLISPIWSPDGRWVAYVHIHETKAALNTWIEAYPAAGGKGKILVSGDSLPKRTLIFDAETTARGLSWLPDWRLIFSARTDPWSASGDIDHSLWLASTGRESADPEGKPERLAHWPDFGSGNFAVTADGKHLSYIKSKTWTDVNLGELVADNRRVLSLRRLTLDNRGSSPTGWTQDSEAILFNSNRTTQRQIFRQSTNSVVATPIISTPGKDCEDGQMSPDGRWILYRESERAKPGASPAPVRLMRRRVDGGPSEEVLEQPSEIVWDYGCGTKENSPCVLSQTEGSDVVLYFLDPLRGKGLRIGKIETPVWSYTAVWALSPDGSHLAFVTEAGRVRILSLDGRTPPKELSLGPTVPRLQSVTWSASGQGLFGTCLCPGSHDLIYVSLTGTVSRLLENGHRQWMINPLPSPDGKHLAFEAQTWDSNVWMIDDF